MMKKSIKYSVVIVFLITVSGLFGCSTLKAPSGPAEEWTPPKWEKTTRSTDTIWEAIREQEVDPRKAFTLVELVDMALASNPSTRQAWQKARAAQTRIKQAESEWYPQATVSAKAEFKKNAKNNNFMNTNQADYTPELDLQFLVLDLGGRAARVSEAKQMLLAANFQYNQALQDLLLDTERSYYEYYSAQAAQVAAEANVKDSKTSLESAQQRFDAGLNTRLDVLQAESDYDDSLYSLEQVKGLVKTTKANLAEVIGLPADAEFEIAPPTQEIPTDITEKDVSLLIEEALRQRPDIAAIRAELRAKKAALAAANSDLWPTLNVGGTGDATEHKYFGSAKNYEDEVNAKRDYGYTAFISVNWDVFDGFDLYSKRNEARAEAAAERENVRQTELAASADVWTKFYNFKTERKKFEFSEARLKSSKEAYELALEGYNVGLKNILDLLSAQSQLSDSRSQLIRSRKDLFVSLVELIHSTGSLHVKEIKEGT